MNLKPKFYNFIFFRKKVLVAFVVLSISNVYFFNKIIKNKVNVTHSVCRYLRCEHRGLSTW